MVNLKRETIVCYWDMLREYWEGGRGLEKDASVLSGMGGLLVSCSVFVPLADKAPSSFLGYVAISLIVPGAFVFGAGMLLFVAFCRYAMINLSGNCELSHDGCIKRYRGWWPRLRLECRIEDLAYRLRYLETERRLLRDTVIPECDELKHQNKLLRLKELELMALRQGIKAAYEREQEGSTRGAVQLLREFRRVFDRIHAEKSTPEGIVTTDLGDWMAYLESEAIKARRQTASRHRKSKQVS